eukprot:763880-Hanusia_phi.AAC.2
MATRGKGGGGGMGGGRPSLLLVIPTPACFPPLLLCPSSGLLLMAAVRAAKNESIWRLSIYRPQLSRHALAAFWAHSHVELGTMMLGAAAAAGRADAGAQVFLASLRLIRLQQKRPRGPRDLRAAHAVAQPQVEAAALSLGPCERHLLRQHAPRRHPIRRHHLTAQGRSLEHVMPEALGGGGAQGEAAGAVEGELFVLAELVPYQRQPRLLRQRASDLVADFAVARGGALDDEAIEDVRVLLQKDTSSLTVFERVLELGGAMEVNDASPPPRVPLDRRQPQHRRVGDENQIPEPMGKLSEEEEALEALEDIFRLGYDHIDKAQLLHRVASRLVARLAVLQVGHQHDLHRPPALLLPPPHLLLNHLPGRAVAQVLETDEHVAPLQLLPQLKH